MYYPIFLNLLGKRCLVVGGGAVALGKVKALVEAGADLTLVAPTIHPKLLDQAGKGLRIWQRPFDNEDLKGAFLVIAATDDRGLNAQIHAQCEDQGVLVNVADDTPLCNFILPSIAKEGPLQIAVSSSGTSPTMARELRQRIQTEILNPELADLADFLGAWRPRINPHLPAFTLKKAYWQAVMKSNISRWLQAGNVRKAATILRDLLDGIRDDAGLPRLSPGILSWKGTAPLPTPPVQAVDTKDAMIAIGGRFEHR